MNTSQETCNSKNVLISLSDKTNLDLLVPNLISNGYSIYSTGGTYKKILEICLESQYSTENVYTIESYINFPEILGGRVKTLHPQIYGGLLENLSKELDIKDLKEHNIKVFDYVFVNLYPFKETLKKYGFDFEKNLKPNYLSEEDELAIIESIDIGGVSLMRASAKNYQYCLPIINPNSYMEFITNALFSKISIIKRIQMAQQAYQVVAKYDNLINQFYLLLPLYQKKRELQRNQFRYGSVQLKYGLNPHQKDARLSWTDLCLENGQYPFTLINGKIGYINLIDAIQSFLLVLEGYKVFNCPCVASFKHTSPAGVGLGNRLISDFEKEFYNLDSEVKITSLIASGYLRARGGDPLSSFGDFIAISHTVDIETANLIKKEVSDGIIAPDYVPEALEILQSKRKGNYLILRGNPNYLDWYLENCQKESRELFGMILSQSPNRIISNQTFLDNSKITSQNQNLPIEARRDLLLANMSLKYAQSNNICYVYQGQVIGLAAGQQNRIDSVVLAGKKAQRWFLRQSPMIKKIMTYLKSEVKEKFKRQDYINLVMEIVKNYEDHHLDQPIRGDNSFKEEYLNHFTGYQDEKELVLDEIETRKYLDENMKEISMASDAFFPFIDNIVRAYQYGVKYIMHPAGSLADEMCLETVNRYNMVMVETGTRMFYH